MRTELNQHATMARRPILVGELPEPCGHCDARGSSVCSALDDKDMNRLAAIAVVMEIAPGQSFIEEGERAEHFFNLTKGTARIFKLLPDGRRQITGFAGRGDFLGLAVSETYAFSAEAIDPVRLCRFTRPKMRSVIEDFRALEHRLLENASNELMAAQEQMLLLGRKTARERLASFLLSRAHSCGQCGQPARNVPLPMTRGDIADYLGLTIETVSRTMTKLRNENLIALDGPFTVTIRNLPGLEQATGTSD